MLYDNQIVIDCPTCGGCGTETNPDDAAEVFCCNECHGSGWIVVEDDDPTDPDTETWAIEADWRYDDMRH